MKIKIVIIAGVMLLLFIVFLVPGFFPIRALESFFYGTCKYVLRGDFNEYNSMSFVGLGGLPIRHDYIECGRTPARDANKVCYIAPISIMSFGEEQGNPLGREMDDQCGSCQYGAETIKDKNTVLGKSCKPYKFVWRWNYKSSF